MNLEKANMLENLSKLSFDWKYVWINIVIFAIAYFIGSINLAIILSKKRGKDLRNVGSGNAGATNAMRNFGIKFGAVIFIFDIFKAYISIMIVFSIKTWLNDVFILPIIAGAGALVGHIFPIFFKLKGGKGVACLFGIVLAFDLMIFTIFVMIYIALILITKYVSLSSALSALVVPYLGFIPIIYSQSFISFMQRNTPYPSHAIIIVICAILIILKHVPNYVRIINKQESKINFYTNYNDLKSK